MADSQGTPPPSGNSWTRPLAAAVVLGLLVVFGRQTAALIPDFIAWVEALGPWGPIAFMAGYVVATVAFVPGSVMTLAGGAIFGLFWGSVYVFCAATVTAGISFLIARYLARDAIEKRIGGAGKFAAIDRAIAAQGRRIVFLLRLSPVFPFGLLNYGMGLTRVSFADYMLASPGMLLGTLLYVYYGQLAGDAAKLVAGAAPEKGTGYYVTMVLGAVATAVVTAMVTRIARQALKEATGE